MTENPYAQPNDPDRVLADYLRYWPKPNDPEPCLPPMPPDEGYPKSMAAYEKHLAESRQSKSVKSLAQMADEVKRVNDANGWTHGQRTFGDAIALLHSEASEALEAYRRWGTDDVTGRECTQEHGFAQTEPHTCKPEGVGSEFADILIRLLDMSTEFGIDLQAEYERKIAHNRTRGHRHGGKRL